MWHVNEMHHILHNLFDSFFLWFLPIVEDRWLWDEATDVADTELQTSQAFTGSPSATRIRSRSYWPDKVDFAICVANQSWVT